jgi:hypothetical protein
MIHVYNYPKGGFLMKIRFEDVNIIKNDDKDAKSIEEYILDLLYDSGYMEH